MKVLVIGSGGREHALIWKLSHSPQKPSLFCAPGNAGIAEIADCRTVNVNQPDELAALAETISADLTIVGPEAPLVAGVSDYFHTRGLRIVAPTAAAARLEGSKIFTKQFTARYKIPTARFTPCDSAQAAADAVRDYTFPVVVKADGLAAGKGVRIAANRSEFDAAISSMMVDRVFGEAGSRILIEECLIGREASVMLFTDGRDYKLLPPAQDYKRVNDSDQGPNTGGMGSFSTPGLIDEQTLEDVARKIIEPTLEGMREEGHPFQGVLYAGLMLTATGPQLIEFNARLGDPETQSVLMRLDSDLLEVFDAVVSNRIGETPINWSTDSAVCVVAASGGYPGEFEKDKSISGLKAAGETSGVVVFHAGTSRDGSGPFVTSGGRVLGITARSSTLAEARARAYEALARINFDRMHYRADIAMSPQG